MAKIINIDEAVNLIKTGSSLMVGGFGNAGAPHFLLEKIAQKQKEINGLTVIATDLGTENRGLGRLVRNGQIKKAIGSFFSYNQEAVRHYFEGKLAIDLLPQGTLAEAIRAGGAGIGGFFCPVGVGTEIFKGAEEREIGGVRQVFVESLRADFALVHAYKADELGNVIYNKAARNFNPAMARAGKYTIVEVEEIVPVGELSPHEIMTPFVFVDALVKVERRDYNANIA